mgnify:CR=1 FL=1
MMMLLADRWLMLDGFEFALHDEKQKYIFVVPPLFFPRARARARRCVLQVFLFRFLVFVFWWWFCRSVWFYETAAGVSPPS